MVGNDLLVIADTTTQIADLGYQAYFCNRRRVGAWLWKHVADLSDLTFLRGSVEVGAERFASCVFKGPDVLANILPRIITASGDLLAVAEVEAKTRRDRGPGIRLLLC